MPKTPEVFGWVGSIVVYGVTHGWLLGIAALTALLGWGACYVWWRRYALRMLGPRTRVQLVPAEAFDPSAAEVAREASRLASVRAAAGALPRRAAGVRIRIAAGADGRLEYWWEGPERAASLLRRPGYRQVEALDPTVDRGARARRIRFSGFPPVKRGGSW
ncbi:hypothetical protein OHA44_37620 [Streptomyces sp. NBC_00144]|uniref:hypothetical protein n=1 Tax=Streptomyces sp. NBC_00144 TaxID=2975665 RepID=UPI00324571F0